MKMANHHPTFALDCSVKSITIAIIKDGQILSSYNDIPQTSQSEELMKIIDNVLKEAKLQFTDIKQVLFCNGPGSFTSLRVDWPQLRGCFGKQELIFIPHHLCCFAVFRSKNKGMKKEFHSYVWVGRRWQQGFLKREKLRIFKKVFMPMSPLKNIFMIKKISQIQMRFSKSSNLNLINMSISMKPKSIIL